MRQNTFMTGAPPREPLRKHTALPQTHSWIYGREIGKGGMERDRGGKGNGSGRKGRGGKRKREMRNRNWGVCAIGFSGDRCPLLLTDIPNTER